MSIPISQFISPFLTPRYSQVCFLHLWPYFCFANKFICTIFFRLHISDVIWYLSFSIWLTSLSMTISSFIHVAANGIILFFFNGWVILGFRLWWSKLPCGTGPHDKELRANSSQNQGGAKALHSIAHESPGDNCVNDPGSSSSQQSLGMTLDKLLRDQEVLSHQALGGSAGK